MLILDRITPDCAVIYDGDDRLTVPLSQLKGCKEGDVLVIKDGFYIPDSIATAKRRRDIISLQNSLWE